MIVVDVALLSDDINISSLRHVLCSVVCSPLLTGESVNVRDAPQIVALPLDLSGDAELHEGGVCSKPECITPQLISTVQRHKQTLEQKNELKAIVEQQVEDLKKALDLKLKEYDGKLATINKECMELTIKHTSHEQQQQRQNRGTCCICLESDPGREPVFAFEGCNHICLCALCEPTFCQNSNILTCPMCNTASRGITRMYFS